MALQKVPVEVVSNVINQAIIYMDLEVIREFTNQLTVEFTWTG